PLIALQALPMKTSFGEKQRPEFAVVDWREIGGGQTVLPPPTTPPALPNNSAADVSAKDAEREPAKPKKSVKKQPVPGKPVKPHAQGRIERRDRVLTGQWELRDRRRSSHSLLLRALSFSLSCRCYSVTTRPQSLDLGDVGTWQYAIHPETRVWCCAYAVDDGPVKLWVPGNTIPPEILEAADDPTYLLSAFNNSFERL